MALWASTRDDVHDCKGIRREGRERKGKGEGGRRGEGWKEFRGMGTVVIAQFKVGRLK